MELVHMDDFGTSEDKKDKLTIDTRSLKEKIDLLLLVDGDTRLRRVASTNGGEWAGPCPFCGGRDRCRVQPQRGWWMCRKCSPDGRWQDAIAYVMRRDGLAFREACRVLGGEDCQLKVQRLHSPCGPAPTLPPADAKPSQEWRLAAGKAVMACEEALWSAVGENARGWLTRRGLSDETLRRWHVGYNGPPDAGGGRQLGSLWVSWGILLPWYVDGEVWHVKVRRNVGPEDGPKYKSISGGHPTIFGADKLAGHNMVVLTEGEFDAMLLHQEVGDLVGVATLGSCQRSLSPQAMRYLLPMARILVAYDTDVDGEKGVAGLVALSARMRQMRVPAGNDITEYWQKGGRLRDWVQSYLAVV